MVRQRPAERAAQFFEVPLNPRANNFIKNFLALSLIKLLTNTFASRIKQEGRKLFIISLPVSQLKLHTSPIIHRGSQLPPPSYKVNLHLIYHVLYLSCKI